MTEHDLVDGGSAVSGNPSPCLVRICDMRRFARVRNAGGAALAALSFASVAFALFAFAGPATAAPSTTTVEIKLAECGIGVYFCFDPSTATVSVGDTVRWTDLSGFTHSVTRCNAVDCEGHDGGTGSDSLLDGTVSPDPVQDFSHTFSGLGTYVYYCSLHGYAAMNGIVTVAAEDTSTTTTTTTAPTTPTPQTAPPTPQITPASTSATAATVRAATAAPTPASSADPVETAAPLARTGSDLRLLSVGLSVFAVGVGCVSAEHRLRRSTRR